MSVGAALSLLAAFWCLIHLAHHLSSQRHETLLPTLSSPASRGWAAFQHHHARRTQTSLKGLKFQVSTTRWNALHDKLGSFLARRGNQRVAAAAGGFYALGTILGALGMLAAVLVLSWMCIAAGWQLVYKMGLMEVKYSAYISQPSMQTLFRRSVAPLGHEDAPTSRPGSPLVSITPIIPGVTVPLAHLPVIIGAVFVSQAIHELGHALAATLDFLPMTACGASLVVCIPAAFVSFSEAAMRGLPAKARARIVAAGPFHNIVFYGVLVLAARLGIAGLVGAVSGYRNIADVGRVVVQVNSDSPLSLHLQPGSVITKLDDTSLASTNDIWAEYLQGTSRNTSLGWCISKIVLAKSDECCIPSSKPSRFSCFETVDRLDRGCIDPVPVLTSILTARCETDAGCAPESLCVAPRADAQLLRLTVAPSLGQIDEIGVVLWSGPADEIWEEVQVGTWVPRIGVLPLWLPPLLGTFWEYLSLATLSLYFFNSLPLPHLDGTELLSALLDMTSNSDRSSVSYDFTALEAGDANGNGYRGDERILRRWKQRILRYVPYWMSGIGMLYILFSILNAVY